MKPWCAIVAVFLAAYLMPATLHCAMESAGVLPEAFGCKEPVTGHCSGDACRQVESGVYKQSGPALKVLAPELLVCACMLCMQLVPALPTDLAAISGFYPDSFSHPQDWLTRWAFEHRAALPARAPSSLTA